MRPDEVPAELVEKARAALEQTIAQPLHDLTMREIIAAVLPTCWEEGYRKGNLDGYFGTSDEWKRVHPDD